MICCPNCHYQNPEGADQCEACYTPLLSASSCPSCGLLVQVGGKYCGHCGFNLASVTSVLTGGEVIQPFAPVTQPLEPEFSGSRQSGAVAVKPNAGSASPQTQLQLETAQLLHIQSNTVIELPPSLGVIHIGKPNDRVTPDIDVSGFAHSNVVSRIHADIRREGDTYYIEDVGSSNGTYINNTPLPAGNRHRLRSGDRISLGKGDLVTFLFSYSQV